MRLHTLKKNWKFFYQQILLDIKKAFGRETSAVLKRSKCGSLASSANKQSFEFDMNWATARGLSGVQCFSTITTPNSAKKHLLLPLTIKT